MTERVKQELVAEIEEIAHLLQLPWWKRIRRMTWIRVGATIPPLVAANPLAHPVEGVIAGMPLAVAALAACDEVLQQAGELHQPLAYAALARSQLQKRPQ